MKTLKNVNKRLLQARGIVNDQLSWICVNFANESRLKDYLEDVIEGLDAAIDYSEPGEQATPQDKV